MKLNALYSHLHGTGPPSVEVKTVARPFNISPMSHKTAQLHGPETLSTAITVVARNRTSHSSIHVTELSQLNLTRRNRSRAPLFPINDTSKFIRHSRRCIMHATTHALVNTTRSNEPWCCIPSWKHRKWKSASWKNLRNVCLTQSPDSG